MTTRSLTMLVHGAAKSGKSSFLATAPEPRLILDVEASSRFLPIKPIVWNPSETPPELDNGWDTAIVPTLTWNDAENVKRWLQTGKHPFNSVLIDSASELQQRHIEHVAGRGQLTQQNWGDVYRSVGGFIRDMRDLTMHPVKPLQFVGMTAMSRQLDGVWKPWANGQLQVILPYLLDVTAYIWVETTADEETKQPKEVRKILTRRTAQFEAGERVGGKLPSVMVVKDRVDGENTDDIPRMIDRIFS